MSNEPTNAENAKEQASSGPIFKKAVDYKTIYTNFVQTAFTPYDISLVLGESTGLYEASAWTVEQKARIVMSPTEAKVVAQLLAQVINNYEQTFGEIHEPKNPVKTEGG